MSATSITPHCSATTTTQSASNNSGAHLPNAEDVPLHKRSHKRIFEICGKQLKELPVGKDIPRLARKFYLYKQQDSSDAVDIKSSESHHLEDYTFSNKHNKEYVEIHHIDKSAFAPNEEIPALNIIYGLLYHINDNLLNPPPACSKQIAGTSTEPETATTSSPTPSTGGSTPEAVDTSFVSYTSKPFPSFEQFSNELNINDHETFNAFILTHCGETHPLTKLLKACQQTIVINVLFQARMALMPAGIQFKDVRGQWKLFIYFPSQSASLSPHSDKVCLAQRRREQVYTKAQPTNKNGSFHMFDMLFQIEWEVRIWFQRDTMEVYDVEVHLLGYLYDNESEEEESPRNITLSPQDAAKKKEKQAELAKKYEHLTNTITEVFKKMNSENLAEKAGVTQSPSASPRVLESHSGASTPIANPFKDRNPFAEIPTNTNNHQNGTVTEKPAAPETSSSKPPKAKSTNSSFAQAHSFWNNLAMMAFPFLFSNGNKSGKDSSPTPTKPMKPPLSPRGAPLSAQPSASSASASASAPAPGSQSPSTLQRSASLAANSAAWFFDKLRNYVVSKNEETNNAAPAEEAQK